MSKYVKNLLTEHLRGRLEGVSDALLVSLSGLDANKNNRLRMELQDKHVDMLVVKNSLARRATEGTPLAVAFEEMEGSLAVVWGAEDIVSLAKLVTSLAEKKEYEALENRGGVMEGARLTPAEVKQVSKWPSREEQLSLLMGQILSPGATLSAQLLAPGTALASQIKQKSEPEESAPEEEAAT
jgi:ribosomal protein L10